MPRITIQSDAALFAGHGAERASVTDPEILAQFHGFHSGNEFCVDGMEPILVESLGLTGGRIRFAFEAASNRLMVTTTYGIKREPDREERKQLVAETERQWREGPGTGVFGFLDDEVPSTALADRLLADHPIAPDALPKYSLCAYPQKGCRATVKWSATGGPHDYLIADLKEAARKKNGAARAVLGEMFLSGELAPHRPRLGIRLLKASAREDNEGGLITLAHAHLMGRGVPRSPKRAERLLASAVEKGSAAAMTCLGELYVQGDDLPADPKRGLELLRQAAEAGYPAAMAVLGNCHEMGIGVPRDLQSAHYWYDQALAAGFEAVVSALERVRDALQASTSLGRGE